MNNDNQLTQQIGTLPIKLVQKIWFITIQQMIKQLNNWTEYGKIGKIFTILSESRKSKYLYPIIKIKIETFLQERFNIYFIERENEVEIISKEPIITNNKSYWKINFVHSTGTGRNYYTCITDQKIDQLQLIYNKNDQHGYKQMNRIKEWLYKGTDFHVSYYMLRKAVIKAFL